jgi:hypothetical protein
MRKYTLRRLKNELEAIADQEETQAKRMAAASSGLLGGLVAGKVVEG